MQLSIAVDGNADRRGSCLHLGPAHKSRSGPPVDPWPHFQRGGKYLRTLLIRRQVLLMRPNNWARYSFAPWLKSASERLHRNELAVALANKLARIAWSELRNDKAFDTHLEGAPI